MNATQTPLTQLQQATIQLRVMMRQHRGMNATFQRNGTRAAGRVAAQLPLQGLTKAQAPRTQRVRTSLNSSPVKLRSRALKLPWRNAKPVRHPMDPVRPRTGQIFAHRGHTPRRRVFALQHWTPRDAVRLMAKLVFLPVADRIRT